jgi:urea carboxylase
MPIILGLDGPSLGGFVCPATIAEAELWKIGQLKPGNTIQFHRLTFDQALQQELQLDRQIQTLQVGQAFTVTMTVQASAPFSPRCPAT